MILNKRIPPQYILSMLKWEIIFVIIIAGTLSYIDQFFAEWGLLFPIIPMSVPALLATLITLVLAFRTSQSYDRWWEARKIWGSIVNDSRNYVREVSFLCIIGKHGSEKQIAFRDEMVRLLMAWSYALVGALRKLPEDEWDNEYITSEEYEAFKRTDQNLPNAILHQMMQTLQDAFDEGLINQFQQVRITETINELCVSMGKSERIKTTVFPKLYSNVIHFMIWSLTIVMPIAYRDPNEYIEFPVVAFISLTFFMLDKIALDLQDPFENQPADISIHAITRNIEIYARRVRDNKEDITKLEPEGFYLM